MNPLVLPQVNLNGTSREQLVEQQCEVMEALRKAYVAMCDASPNGRDYQTMPVGTLAKAQEAWAERVLAVHAMLKEIETHAMAIQDAAP